jgi:hypothetical protein
MACEDLQNTVVERSKALMEKLQEKSAALSDEIKQEAEGLDPDLDTSGIDAWVGLDIEVGWKRVEFSLDLPEVTLKDQTWALDLPQVTMKDQDIIFHTPSMRMERTKTGEYPETTCGWHVTKGPFGIKTKTWQCTVHWSPIYMDVPVPFMEEQRIRMGVPEFRMDRTEVILAIPEFALRTQSFALDLPSFTVKDIKVVAAETQEKGRQLEVESKRKADELKASYADTAKGELSPLVTDLFYCYENDLASRRNEALTQFDRSIAAMQAMVNSLVANKCPADDPTLIKANENLAKVQEARAAFATQIEEAFKTLHAEQRAFFEKLMPAD